MSILDALKAAVRSVEVQIIYASAPRDRQGQLQLSNSDLARLTELESTSDGEEDISPVWQLWAEV